MTFEEFKYEKGSYLVQTTPDVEFIDPVGFWHKAAFTTTFNMEQHLMTSVEHGLDSEALENYLANSAMKFADKTIDEIWNTTPPPELMTALFLSSKKEQVAIIGENLSINSSELASFIMHACREHGFLFSQYHTEHKPIGTDESKLPKMIHKVSDTEVISVGDTPLSEGQQRALVDQRTVKVAKFLDHSDGTWHCLFLTYRSLAGKEEGHPPHLDYITAGVWRVRKH